MTDTIAPPRLSPGSSELADRLFWAAQRAVRIERNPLGIGRKVEPGALDIERLVLAGSLTTSPAPFCDHRHGWEYCPVCCH